MTASEWKAYFDEFPCDPWLAEGSHGWDEMILNLAACEKERDGWKATAKVQSEAAAGYLSRAEKAEAELLRYDLAIQSLTPGGSEFVHDPERCVETVRELRQGEHYALIRAKAENADLSLRLEQMREALDRLHEQRRKADTYYIGSALCDANDALLSASPGELAREVVDDTLKKRVALILESKGLVPASRIQPVTEAIIDVLIPAIELAREVREVLADYKEYWDIYEGLSQGTIPQSGVVYTNKIARAAEASARIRLRGPALLAKMGGEG